VPAHMRVTLAERLAGSQVDVLQHGFSHKNHQPHEEKKAEFGDARPLAAMQEELARGWQRLAALFGKRPLPVLGPPWNRIDEGLAATLSALGYVGLSISEPRVGAMDGLVRANTHIDILDWTAQPRRFIGADAAFNLTLAHLAARRAGTVDCE